MNDATHLVLEPGRTVLRRGAASHELRLGIDGIARSFRSEPPTPRELEHAIDLLEDELARVPRSLHGPGRLATADARLLGWTSGIALCSREQVEALFQRLSSAALGDPSALRGLPQDRHAAAALLLVREAMHHLRYDELRTVVDVHSQGSRKRVGSSSRPPMELPMQDESVLQHITKLVEEERDLVSSAAPVAEKEARLKHVGEELDRCWDLLRQRRAKREFGGDPDSAHVRDTRTVEGYEG
jgi:hypothetical protein